ncbi:MAG: hypothetical protein ABI210_00060 [Abditibacteriaceae bacterium]
MQKISFWPLNKLIVLLALGGYFMFLMELRFEHMDVLGERWQSWIPLVYSAIMIVICVWGLWFWKRAGRKVLFWAFAASIIVGLLGVWFHDKGKPWKSITVVVQAWQAPIVKEEGEKAKPLPGATKSDGKKEKEKEKPNPPLAPLSFAGIGLLGMLACWKDEIKNDG